MPEEQDTALISVPASTQTDVDASAVDTTAEAPDPADQIGQLAQQAAATVITQDVAAAAECASLARGIFEDARAKYDEDSLAMLGVLCDVTCLYEPLARGILMQAEGRFTDALSRFDEAIQLTQEIQKSLSMLGERPNCKPFAIQLEPIMRPFPSLLRGSRIAAEAELYGYQGNTETYLQFLQKAVAELRTVKSLRPSANPTFRQLVQICNNMADRLETRTRNFEPMLRNVRYMAASGDKILIIHGQNEGKRRELKELLEQRGWDVVVVEEMPDSGAVLIEKCIKYAAECSFAIALFTPDDMVKAGKTKVFQARPNVLFELGWFYGRFGPSRVLILKQEGTGLPSDLAGVLTKNFHANISEIIEDIAKELPAKKPQAAPASA